MSTHEQFIGAVRDAALLYASRSLKFTTVQASALGNDWRPSAHIPYLPTASLQRIARAKLLYGRGFRGLRGVTQFGAWKNGSTDELIEVCAASEESWVQLAGTTIHELAHVAAGPGAGHGKAWKEACAALGLRRVKAAGTVYHLANFAPELRMQLAALPKPADGTPALGGDLGALGQMFTGPVAARPCSHGIGSRGGTSRGPGSGSRLRKYVCGHGQIIRASTDDLQCTCNACGGPFQLSA